MLIWSSTNTFTHFQKSEGVLGRKKPSVFLEEKDVVGAENFFAAFHYHKFTLMPRVCQIYIVREYHYKGEHGGGEISNQTNNAITGHSCEAK